MEQSEIVERATALASFLLGPGPRASTLAQLAVNFMPSERALQNKRFAYKVKQVQARRKCCKTEAQMVQESIYYLSEQLEVADERAMIERGEIDKERIARRFVKTLIKEAVCRTAPWVTVAVCRILCRYSEGQTADVMQHLTHRYGDERSCRRMKKMLLKAVESRFSHLIEHGVLKFQQPKCGNHGFEMATVETEHIELLRESLNLLTPWETTCIRQRRSSLDSIAASGDARLDEVGLIHNLLHFSCLESLISEVGLQPLEQMISMPHIETTLKESRSP